MAWKNVMAKLATIAATMSDDDNRKRLEQAFYWNVPLENVEGIDSVVIVNALDVKHFFADYWDWNFCYISETGSNTPAEQLTAFIQILNDFKSRHQYGVRKAVEAYYTDYNPLENYDRIEDTSRSTTYGKTTATDYGRSKTTGYGRELHSADSSVMGEENANGKTLGGSVEYVEKPVADATGRTSTLDVFTETVTEDEEGTEHKTSVDTQNAVTSSGKLTAVEVKDIKLNTGGDGDKVKTTNSVSTYQTDEKEESSTSVQGTTAHLATGKGSHDEITSGSDTENYSGTDTELQSGTDTDKTEGHIHGNIGVTTSQQMLQSEIDLRLQQDMTSWFFETLAKECLIMGVIDDDCMDW